MTIIPHDEADRTRLAELVRHETDAKQRDRYRAVLLAIIGHPVDLDRASLIRSIEPDDRQPGRPPKLTSEQEGKLRARLDAAARDGPPVGDGVCTLRGRDVCRIVEQEFGVVHTLGGIYDVLRRLGYSSLVPRPRHRKNDPAAVAKFQEDAPLLPAP